MRDAIADGQAVDAADVALDQAMSITGVRAVFGERYPDPVRVVSIGAPVDELIANPGNPAWMDHSIRFCGGTHLERTDAADDFVLLSEQGLAAGIRRIVALTGDAARSVRAAGDAMLGRAAGLAAA